MRGQGGVGGRGGGRGARGEDHTPGMYLSTAMMIRDNLLLLAPLGAQGMPISICIVRSFVWFRVH